MQQLSFTIFSFSFKKVALCRIMSDIDDEKRWGREMSVFLSRMVILLCFPLANHFLLSVGNKTLKLRAGYCFKRRCVFKTLDIFFFAFVFVVILDFFPVGCRKWSREKSLITLGA